MMPQSHTHRMDDDMADPVTAHDTISTAELAATSNWPAAHRHCTTASRGGGSSRHGTLHLFADHARVGRHTDSTGREVILSCGAVLDHLEVAAAAAGGGSPSTGIPTRTITTISRRSSFTGQSPRASTNVCWAKRSRAGAQIGWRSRHPSRGRARTATARGPRWHRRPAGRDRRQRKARTGRCITTKRGTPPWRRILPI